MTSAAPDGLATFAEQRSRLFGVAYRMLGSVADAEDVVQEAYLRWAGADRASVRSAPAFLTTVVTRLAIDRLRSAQHRREAYVGPWLPEPLVAEQAPDAAAPVEVADSLRTAFLLMLERLNPLERAVFLLHEVFGYGYDEVAEVVERPASSCRQAASRARSRLADGRPRFRPEPDEERRLVAAFGAAAAVGDLDALEAVLSDDVVLWSDGGPDRHAARRPVVGPARVARFVASVTRRLPPDAEVAEARINGDPGIVVSSGGRAYLTLAAEPGPTGLVAIHVVLNPAKLRHLDGSATTSP